MLAVLALLAPVLLLPGLAWGAAGRLRPAAYPAAWLTAARTLDANPARGSVLLLPWATYRTPPWNHGEVVLDPWTRLLSRPLIWNDGTQVGDVALAPDDPRARGLAGAIRGSGPLTATLRAAGVRFVLDDADGPQPQLAAPARIGNDHRPARPDRLPAPGLARVSDENVSSLLLFNRISRRASAEGGDPGVMSMVAVRRGEAESWTSWR